MRNLKFKLSLRGKAYEQYLLDTGKHLSVKDGNFLNIEKLVRNVDSEAGWNGPYISQNELFDADRGLRHNKYRAVYFVKLKGNAEWTADPKTCTAGDCYVYALILGRDSDLTLSKNVDEYVENLDGELAGQIRYYNAPVYHLLKKIMVYPS